MSPAARSTGGRRGSSIDVRAVLIHLDAELLEGLPIVVDEGTQEPLVVADADGIAVLRTEQERVRSCWSERKSSTDCGRCKGRQGDAATLSGALRGVLADDALFLVLDDGAVDEHRRRCGGDIHVPASQADALPHARRRAEHDVHPVDERPVVRARPVGLVLAPVLHQLADPGDLRGCEDRGLLLGEWQALHVADRVERDRLFTNCVSADQPEHRTSPAGRGDGFLQQNRLDDAVASSDGERAKGDPPHCGATGLRNVVSYDS